MQKHLEDLPCLVFKEIGTTFYMSTCNGKVHVYDFLIYFTYLSVMILHDT